MELNSPKQIRSEYLKMLASDGNYNDVFIKLVNKKDNEPIYTIKSLNGEDAPDYNNEQRELSEIVLDLNCVNNSLIEIKNKAVQILTTLESRAETILNSIQKETERIMDMNILCGGDNNFSMSIPIYTTNFTDGAFESINEKTIGANLLTSNEISYTITSVNGNGYSGNNYVYNNNTFESETNDLGNLEYIQDNGDTTAYEYSRLITNDKTEIIDSLINYDDKAVECVLTLFGNESFCKCSILSENTDLTIKNIETSSDGSIFTSHLSNSIEINNLEYIYNDSTYIYGSNILCFPYCNYLRLTLSSNKIEDDTIAIKDRDDNIRIYPNTKRKKISINNIKLYSSTYKETTITSQEILEGGSVDKVGLFVSEYIPDHFTEDNYLIYYLIVNGTEYEVIPVNSLNEGIKLIKFSEKENSAAQNYFQNITENIKNVQIKIKIKPYKDTETPYISNIKLCLGKDNQSIYV